MTPEQQKEQIRADNFAHLKRCVTESEDVNLSAVQVDDLIDQDIQPWGALRALFQKLKQHENDQELTREIARELLADTRRIYLSMDSSETSIGETVDGAAPKRAFNPSQTQLRAFIKNCLGAMAGIDIIVHDPEEWVSYYNNFLRPLVEKYK